MKIGYKIIVENVGLAFQVCFFYSTFSISTYFLLVAGAIKQTEIMKTFKMYFKFITFLYPKGNKL